jgi:hypothetical protein
MSRPDPRSIALAVVIGASLAFVMVIGWSGGFR